MSLLKNPCFYCGNPKSNLKTRGSRTFEYNGIDRINSDKGYTVRNVLTACKFCNFMKKDHTQNDFKNQIVSIYKHWAACR